MSINNFIPGSSLFRKHLEKIGKDNTYYHFFVTQTLKPEFCRSKTVNEQYKDSITAILRKVGIFTYAHIVAELHENGNLHYHMLLSILTDTADRLFNKSKIPYHGHEDEDQPIEIQTHKSIYDFIKYKYTLGYAPDELFNHHEPFLDFRAFKFENSFLDYLHKDIDRLYTLSNGWKTVKFVIYSKVTTLGNLQDLIHFKH